MANIFNFKTTESYNEESIKEFSETARIDFSNNHANDSELTFRVVAIGRDEDNDTTNDFDIVEEFEPSRESIWQLCQHSVANFKPNDDVDNDTETIEIILEACRINDEEGIVRFESIILAVSERVRRTRKEVIDDIIGWLSDNDDAFTEIIEDCDDWDGYLDGDRWYSMDDLEDMLSGKDIIEILNMAKFGADLEEWDYDSHGEKKYASFNACRDWFRLDGYGNLESSNYRDYSDKIDRWAVEEIEENRGHLTSLDDYDELVTLFDELEMADC